MYRGYGEPSPDPPSMRRSSLTPNPSRAHPSPLRPRLDAGPPSAVYHRKSVSMAQSGGGVGGKGPGPRPLNALVPPLDVSRATGNSGRKTSPSRFTFELPPLLGAVESEGGEPETERVEVAKAAPSPVSPVAPKDSPRVPSVTIVDPPKEKTPPKLRPPNTHIRKLVKAVMAQSTGSPLQRASAFKQALFECGKNKRVYTYGEYKRAMRGVLDRAHLPPADMEDIDYDLEDVFEDMDTGREDMVTLTQCVTHLAFDDPHLRELYRRTCEALPTPLTDTFRLSAAAAFRCFGDVLTSAALGQLLLACGVQNSEAERGALLDFLDVGHSGFITPDEAREWMNTCAETRLFDEYRSAASRTFSDQQCVVDVVISACAEEGAAYHANGYTRLEPSLNFGNLGAPLHLWMRKMSEASCASASEKDASVALKTLRATRVLDLYICKQEVDPCLVCDGYTRLEYNTNTGSMFSGGMHVWLRRNEAKPSDAFPILDLALVVGQGTPSRRGYRRLSGNLNSGALGKPIFLWYLKASYEFDTYDVHDSRGVDDLKHGLEDRLQQIIRLYAAENAQLPGSQTPATPYNFGAVFARLRGAVPPGTAVGQLTKKQFLANVVSELGVYVPKDYALHLWQRLDSNGDGSVALEEFEDFVNANMVEVAAKKREVLDCVLEALETGGTFAQMFGPLVNHRTAGRGGSRQEQCVSEDGFLQGLTRFRVTLSVQERSALLSGFGFTTEGFLALTSLQGQAEEHKAKKTRVDAALTKLRTYATAAAKEALAHKLPRDKHRGYSNINIEGVWAELNPVRGQRSVLVTKDGLSNLLYQRLKMTAIDLHEDEVGDVLSLVSPGKPALEGITLTQLADFIAPEEVVADRVVLRFVTLIRSMRGNPVDHFSRLPRDRTGTIGASDFRRYLNDIVAEGDEESKGDPSLHIAPFTPPDVSLLTNRLDRDSDGNLSIEELLSFIRSLTLKLVERRMVVPPTPTPTSFDLPYLTAIYLSTSTDQEAAYTRRGCKSVPGSLADSVGTKLWCEFESVEGSEATTPFNAIVALCVTQPSTQRVVVDVLLTAGYQRLVLLAGGGGVWGLRQCDMTAVEPTAPITSVALTQLSADGKAVAPSSDPQWRAGGNILAKDGGTTCWYLGGIQHELTRQPDRLLALASPIKVEESSTPAAPALPVPCVECLLVSASHLAGTHALTRARADVSVRSHKPSALCSSGATTVAAPISGGEVVWAELTEGVEGIGAKTPLTLNIDVGKATKPDNPDDSMFDLQVDVSGSGPDDKPVPLCVGTLPLLWHERNDGAGRLQSVDVFDARGLRAGSVKLWVCYRREGKAIRGGVGVDPTAVVEMAALKGVAPAVAAPPAAAHALTSDDEDTLVRVGVGACGSLAVTLCDATCSAGFKGVSVLKASVWIGAGGARLSSPVPIGPSAPKGSLHSWSQAPILLPLQQAWLDKGRCIVEVTAVPAVDEWADTPSAPQQSVCLGKLRFALQDLVQPSKPTLCERFTLRNPEPAAAKVVGGPVELLLKFDCTVAGAARSTDYADVITDIRSQFSASPGALRTLTQYVDMVSNGGRVSVRELDAGLKKAGVSLAVPAMKAYVAGLLRGGGGTGISSDDDAPPAVSVRADTLVSVERVLATLRPVGASLLSTPLPSPTEPVMGTTVAKQMATPSTPAQLRAPAADAAFAAVVKAFRAATVGDPSCSIPLGALASRDRDGTGYVTVDDLLSVLRQMGVHVPGGDMTLILDSLNVHVDHFGKLNYKHFVTQLSSYLPTELSAAEMALRKRVRESAWFGDNYLDFRAPFAAADVLGHGKLTLHEFQDAVGRLGVPMSKQELTAIARRLDGDGDGTIDYYEFSKLIDLDPFELATIGSRIAAYAQSSASDRIAATFDKLRAIDVLHSGEVTGREFRDVILHSNFPLSGVEVALLSRHFSSGVGTVDYNRFSKFCATGMEAGVHHASSPGPGPQPLPFSDPPPPPTSSQSLTDSLLLQRLRESLPREHHAILTSVARALEGLPGASQPNTSREAVPMGMSTPARPAPSPRRTPSEAKPVPPLPLPLAASESVTLRGYAQESVRRASYPIPSLPSARPPSSPPAADAAAEEKRSAYQKDGFWTCPVCQFAQTVPWRATCAMCVTRNPFDTPSSLRCAACDFANVHTAERCKMCGLALTAGLSLPPSRVPDRPPSADPPAHSHSQRLSQSMRSPVLQGVTERSHVTHHPPHRRTSSQELSVQFSVPEGPRSGKGRGWSALGVGVHSSVSQRAVGLGWEEAGRSGVGYGLGGAWQAAPGPTGPHAPPTDKWGVGGRRRW